ncbi:PEGA domain-containing protein [Salinibacter altiplanensis]|uniref:PEGA domain-containing protein n=1 Tax=Salinibacter altiplanensis TaxID=1803181 RepID=UPI001F3C14D4|nr:PEGA domain-containing protein [Salinibacter altiplanensis]
MAGDAPSSEEPSSPRSGQGSPSWEPYRPPQKGGGGVLRRYAFSITVGIAALAVGALIYFAPTRLAPERSASLPTSDERRATLSVSSEPSGAVVIVGADTVGTTPVNNHRLSPGAYLVTVDQQNSGSRDTVVTLSAGESTAFTSRFSQGEPSP